MIGFRPTKKQCAVASLFAALLSSGCTAATAPPIETPSPANAIALACAQAGAAIPARVKDQNGSIAPSGLVATWGSTEQIVWRCGVDKPAGLQPTSPCAEVNGVGWFAEDRESAWRFTTIGRAGYAEVTVPKKYAPEADVLVELTQAAKRLPELKKCQ